MKKKLLSVIAAAALAMTSFAAFATTASAALSADKVICDITFSANGNTRTVENVTLPHTFSCEYASEDGELDYIIRGLYGWNSGFCGSDANPTVSGSGAVIGGMQGWNQYITVNGAFDGTVTASGEYNERYQYYDPDDEAWYDDSNIIPYTLTITCSAPKAVLLSTEWDYLGDFGSKTDPDDKASLWMLGVTPGTEAVTSVGIKVKDNNNEWHGSTDAYTTPAISSGTVIFGVVVNHSALDLYGIGSVVNNTDLLINLVY